jgi:hypothetical protein
MSAEKKRDIYVITSGMTPLHAVYTERQAKRFVEAYGHPTDDCRLFLGLLVYHKVKLIPPRKFRAREVSRSKEIIREQAERS